MGKTDSIWGNCQLKEIWIVRKKQRQNNTFPLLLFSWAQRLHSQLLYLCPSKWYRGMRNGGLWAVHNSSSWPLIPPHTFPVPWRGSFHRLQCSPTLAWSPRGCRGFLLQHLECRPPSSSSLLGVAGLFLTLFPLRLHCRAVFFPFLNTFCQGAQLWVC